MKLKNVHQGSIPNSCHESHKPSGSALGIQVDYSLSFCVDPSACPKALIQVHKVPNLQIFYFIIV